MMWSWYAGRALNVSSQTKRCIYFYFCWFSHSSSLQSILWTWLAIAKTISTEFCISVAANWVLLRSQTPLHRTMMNYYVNWQLCQIERMVCMYWCFKQCKSIINCKYAENMWMNGDLKPSSLFKNVVLHCYSTRKSCLQIRQKNMQWLWADMDQFQSKRTSAPALEP